MSAETTGETETFPVLYSYGQRKADPSPVRRIPWSVAERAYMVYSGRYGTSQSMELLASRGGFSPEELDEYVPGWRDEVSELARLRAEVAKLTAERDEARVLSAAIVLHPNPSETIGWLHADARRLLTVEARAARYREALEEAERALFANMQSWDVEGYPNNALIARRQRDEARRALTEGADHE